MAAKLKNVKVTVRKGIAWVMLNRPEKRNAMSPSLHWIIRCGILSLIREWLLLLSGAKVVILVLGKILKSSSVKQMANPTKRNVRLKPLTDGDGKGCINMISRP